MPLIVLKKVWLRCNLDSSSVKTSFYQITKPTIMGSLFFYTFEIFV